MQTKNCSTTLLTVLPAIQAFTFTGPDPSKPIDINQEVVITWSGSIPDNLSQKLDFSWYSEPNQLNSLGSDISQLVDDIYLSDHVYKFRFHNSKKMLISFAKELATGKLFSFQAVFTDQEDNEVVYWSQNYTLTGLHKKWNAQAELDL
ncbi:hypothetical protein FHETE_6147 [Fusarium heterosporum]|uniref:Uncharacterized protein n=1 Tax=Fusarium heterosporum TaxID=42747 RepID=A0A8H5WQJ0_FUSHE|nr:hypothetical protein FHETE_6147 [Fusarium heterosporum]